MQVKFLGLASLPEVDRHAAPDGERILTPPVSVTCNHLLLPSLARFSTTSVLPHVAHHQVHVTIGVQVPIGGPVLTAGDDTANGPWPSRRSGHPLFRNR